MTDLALAIIIAALIVVSSPVWIPLAYLIGLFLIGIFFAALGGLLAGILWLAIWLSEVFRGSRA